MRRKGGKQTGANQWRIINPCMYLMSYPAFKCGASVHFEKNHCSILSLCCSTVSCSSTSNTQQGSYHNTASLTDCLALAFASISFGKHLLDLVSQATAVLLWVGFGQLMGLILQRGAALDLHAEHTRAPTRSRSEGDTSQMEASLSNFYFRRLAHA